MDGIYSLTKRNDCKRERLH